ncbi:MAG: hypothetical protein Q8K36_01220, partial [Alphaproteobacteria bacterium]|nr:hypothetical protein [Alphaproteobacteria bacterium]
LQLLDFPAEHLRYLNAFVDLNRDLLREMRLTGLLRRVKNTDTIEVMKNQIKAAYNERKGSNTPMIKFPDEPTNNGNPPIAMVYHFVESHLPTSNLESQYLQRRYEEFRRIAIAAHDAAKQKEQAEGRSTLFKEASRRIDQEKAKRAALQNALSMIPKATKEAERYQAEYSIAYGAFKSLTVTNTSTLDEVNAYIRAAEKTITLYDKAYNAWTTLAGYLTTAGMTELKDKISAIRDALRAQKEGIYTDKDKAADLRQALLPAQQYSYTENFVFN